MSAMLTINSAFIVVIFILNVVRFCNPFFIGIQCHGACRQSSKVHALRLSSNKLADEDEDDENENERNTLSAKTSSLMTLNLVGKTLISSEPIPINVNRSMHDFFALPHTAELLLRGSRNNTIHEITNIDSELYEQYRRNCEIFDASLPSAEDRVYNVTTSGVRFPGLRVMSTVTIGVKLITTSTFPSYEIILIRDFNYAEGNPLFLWFFNKVTGSDKVVKDKKVQSAFSINRIYVNLDNDMILFQGDATLRLLLQFPSFLLKALPGASKEKYEQTGSKYLKKALEDDLPAALEGLRTEYIRWLGC